MGNASCKKGKEQKAVGRNHLSIITESKKIGNRPCAVSEDAGATAGARRGGADASACEDRWAAEQLGECCRSSGKIPGQHWGRKDERGANDREQNIVD